MGRGELDLMRRLVVAIALLLVAAVALGQRHHRWPDVYLASSLPANGGAPYVKVVVDYDQTCKIALWAASTGEVAAIGRENNGWELVAQDTTEAAATKHLLGGNPDWSMYEGDAIHLVANVYNTSDVFIETVAIINRPIDSTGQLEEWMWCAHALPADAVSEGWMFGAADTSNYDRVLNVADGAFMKYCGVGTTDEDAVYLGGVTGFATARAEDDESSWPAGSYMTGLWYDLSGITKRAKVQYAYLILTTPAATGISFTSGYVTARLDTVGTDAPWLNAPAYGADPLGLDVTWNDIDASKGTPWPYSFDDRDDFHDWGPRGDASNTSTVAAGGQSVRIDVTDAVQQYLDRGDRGVNAGFWPYASSTVDDGNGVTFSLGPSSAHGSPVLVVGWTDGVYSRPPWDVTGMPFAVTLDNADHSHKEMGAMMRAADGTHTQAVCALYDSAFIDSMYQAGIDIMLHTANYDVFMDCSDPDDQECWTDMLTRDWLDTAFPTSAPNDTSLVEWTDFAYTAGTGQAYTVLGMRALWWRGYKSARCFDGTASSVDSIGALHYLEWDNHVNIFAVGQKSTAGLKATTYDAERELLLDHIDAFYNANRQPTVMMMHYLDGVLDHMTLAEFSAFALVIGDLDCAAFVSYEDVIGARTEGLSTITPTADFADTEYLTGAAWADHVWYEPVDHNAHFNTNDVDYSRRARLPAVVIGDAAMVAADSAGGGQLTKVTVSCSADSAAYWYLQWRINYDGSWSARHFSGTTPNASPGALVYDMANTAITIADTVYVRVYGKQRFHALSDPSVVRCPWVRAPDTAAPEVVLFGNTATGDPVTLGGFWTLSEYGNMRLGWSVNGGTVTWGESSWTDVGLHNVGIATGNASSSGDVYVIHIDGCDIYDNCIDPPAESLPLTIP